MNDNQKVSEIAKTLRLAKWKEPLSSIGVHKMKNETPGTFPPSTICHKIPNGKLGDLDKIENQTISIIFEIFTIVSDEQ